MSISLTTKCRLFARKKRLAKRNKATLISFWRAISADIGREFCPLRCACWFWWPNNLHICSCLCKTLFELLINMFICFFASHHNTLISHYKYISEVADICKEKHHLTKLEMVHFNVSKVINRTGSTSCVKPPILYML